MRELQAGPELDAAIGKLMGLDVLGVSGCSREPECGEWEPTGHWAESGREGAPRAVYLRRCCCEFARAEDPRTFGHTSFCLGVVPAYSSEIAAAWLVVEKLRSRKVDVMIFQGERREFPSEIRDRSDDQWECALWWQENGEHRETTQHADTPAEAICRAALRAVKVPV